MSPQTCFVIGRLICAGSQPPLWFQLEGCQSSAVRSCRWRFVRFRRPPPSCSGPGALQHRRAGLRESLVALSFAPCSAFALLSRAATLLDGFEPAAFRTASRFNRYAGSLGSRFAAFSKLAMARSTSPPRRAASPKALYASAAVGSVSRRWTGSRVPAAIVRHDSPIAPAEMIQPLRGGQGQRLLGVAARGRVMLQIVIEAGQAEENRVIGRLQFPSLFHPGQGARRFPASTKDFACCTSFAASRFAAASSFDFLLRSANLASAARRSSSRPTPP